MYAFTDRAIAQLLIEEADAGTVIRVYRDGEQYEEEERDQRTEAVPWHRCFEGIPIFTSGLSQLPAST